jgi:hypothetical protein
MALCTLRGSGYRDFAAIYGRGPAVVVETTGARFQRLLVSSKDAEAKVSEIERAAGLGHTT